MAVSKMPLIGGMYEARSVIASAQRCVNLYAEKNAEDSPYPFTYYPTPGLTQLIAGPNASARCAFTASNGQLYEVIGDMVYATSPLWVRSFLGTIGAGTNPVSMADNGMCVLLVDGTPNGYGIDMVNNAFAQVQGQGGAFYGADRVDYVDTFFVLNVPGTNQWYVSLSNVTLSNLTGTTSPDTTAAAFDPLDIAAKTGNPDPIQAVIVMHREPWVIGTETSEVWYDAGNPNFSFQAIPGVFIEHGCCAKYSLAKQDLSVYWLSQDRQGNAIVLMGNQYAAKRISTHAIEQVIQDYAVISDAIGLTYQQLGHTYYVLTFPTADATWVYDVAEGLWHERVWLDANGIEHRIRPNTVAACYGTIVAADWETGALYRWDKDAYTDNGQPIICRRGFPIEQMFNRRVEYSRLIIDMDAGEVETTLAADEPKISLRYSDDRGKNWGNPVVTGIGATGDYGRSILFSQLGQARNRVFELFWTLPALAALNGGDVWADPSET